MRGVIVGYYTNAFYEHEASRLLKSAIALKLHPCYVTEVQTQNDWKADAHLRPTFLLDMIERFPTQPLLSLDVDAFIHEDPWPHLEHYQFLYDIAFHTFKKTKEKLPGTLLINNTRATRKLLKVWHALNQDRSQHFDRVNFAAAVQIVDELRIGALPPELCWIFDLFPSVYGTKQPIIEHLQASRSFKRKGTKLERNRDKRLEELNS